MRCFVKLVLLIVSLAFVQGQPVTSDLNALLLSSEFQQYLSVDQLQQLRREIFTTTLTSVGNHLDLPAIAQALQQLIAQYVPQVKQMDIDWIAVGQSALDAVIIAPGGHFRKRDLDGNALQLLSQLSPDQLVQIAEAAALPDRTTALAKLEQLLEEFFSAGQGRTNFDDLAENLLNHLDNMFPHFNQQNLSYRR